MSAEKLKETQVSSNTALAVGIILILWIIGLIIYAFVTGQKALGGNLCVILGLTVALWAISGSLSRQLLEIYQEKNQ